MLVMHNQRLGRILDRLRVDHFFWWWCLCSWVRWGRSPKGDGFQIYSQSRKVRFQGIMFNERGAEDYI